MKIFKKRVIALIIDSFILGIFLVIFKEILKKLNLEQLDHKNFELLLFIPFFFRDVTFRNASIGKFVLGIEVYTNDWKKPKFIHLLRREFCMTTVGFLSSIKAMFVDGNIIDVLRWEQNVLKSFVIDKKVFKKIVNEVDKIEGDRTKKLTYLYNLYLEDLYSK